MVTVEVMYEKYHINLNIDGTGAVVAAPDLETPGDKNAASCIVGCYCHPKQALKKQI